MIALIGGFPGSGKSYFAEKLAARTGSVFISSDKVRKFLLYSGKYAMQDKVAVYNEIRRLAEKHLHNSDNVVIDATFSHYSMRDPFFRLVEKHSLPLCFIWVYAKEALIKERLSRPRQDSEADYKVYEQVRDQFEEITIPHLKMESRNDNISLMLNKGIDYIQSCYERK